MLGFNGYSRIWALFGSANQLLVVLAIVLAVEGVMTIFGGKKKAAA